MSKRALIVLGILLLTSWSLMAGNIIEINKSNTTGLDFRSSKGTPTVVTRAAYNNRDVADTMSYTDTWNTQFVQSPGDAMIVAFQMPADGYIKGVNVPIVEWGTGDQQMTVALYELTYPYGIDANGDPIRYPLDIVNGVGWIGGYDMMADSGAMVFDGEIYTPPGTPPECAGGASDVAEYAADPLGQEDSPFGPPGLPLQGLIWPDGFVAPTLDPTNNPGSADEIIPNWLATSDFGTEPFVEGGTWVGVLVFFSGDGGGADHATGFWYVDGEPLGLNDPWVALKFYAGCGGTSGSGGWHIRNWVFGFDLAVLLTGDRGPTYGEEETLVTTVSEDPIDYYIDAYDDNPSGGDAGVDNVVLKYQLDSTTAAINDVAMTADGDRWSGQIPGQAAGTMVYYWVEGTDVNGNATTTPKKSYYIFLAEDGDYLIFNNTTPLYGNMLYVPYCYFAWECDVDGIFDIWDASYGNITADLVGNYDVILEITSYEYPSWDSDAALQPWFAAGNKTYVVEGDEWLGTRYGWSGDVAIPAGDFAEDIGIAHYYPDINGAADAVSRLTPVAGDDIGGPMATFLTDSSCVLDYDPNYDPGHSNWLDGIDAGTGATVAYEGLDGAVDVTTGDPDGTTTYTTGIYGTYGTSNAAFFSFDIMSLYARDYSTGAAYWVGAYDYDYYEVSPFRLAMTHFGANGGVGVDDNNLNTPTEFALKGNYPNPFNPTTNISYTLDVSSSVTVSVYSLLGQKIATIHNGHQNAGDQTVTWSGTNDFGQMVASGMYLYQVKSEGRSLTGKMMLLK